MKEQEYFGGAASNYFCNVDGQTGGSSAFQLR